MKSERSQRDLDRAARMARTTGIIEQMLIPAVGVAS
jgi:hypothetical protein